MSKIEQFNSMDGYTFDEGVAFLRLCQAPEGVVMHIASTHNKSHLHSEIHKQLRMPGTMRLLQEKGFGREEVPTVPESHKIEPKTHENTQKLDKIEPKSNENEPKSDETESRGPEVQRPESDDESDIILTKLDVRTHENTRYEDMPNDITRDLWLKRQDLYREMQQNHLKMRQVPKGKEHDDERAQYRAEVLRLDDEIDNIWKLIDAEIERFKADNERADKKAEGEPDFEESTYRSYISKAPRKKKLTDAQRVELQHRVDALIAAKMEIKPETKEKLKAIGIRIG